MITQAAPAETNTYLRVLRTDEKPRSDLYERLKFFYIGLNEKLVDDFSYHFVTGEAAAGLSKAIEILSQKTADKLPDVIFIDVPMHGKDLQRFCHFLKTNKLVSLIPVIYNLAQLTKNKMTCAAQMKTVEKMGCVDDILDIHSQTINFAAKIAFIKEVKYNQAAVSSFVKRKKAIVKKRNVSTILKRSFDVLVSLIAIILLSPLLLLIAVVIKLESGGPVLYNAPRAGRHFRVFNFYKFRTMIVGADKNREALSHLNQYNKATEGPVFFKIANDPRVTRLGKFLRNSSLDELPQLFNVLFGDMSIVGNRPLPLYEAVTLTTNEFMERFNAPAGITGLWQIKKRGKADMSIEERISLDISYARTGGLFVDFGIIAKTPMALLQKTNV